MAGQNNFEKKEKKIPIFLLLLFSECGICMDILIPKDMFKMECCHKDVCKNCIKHWHENKRDCPFCRQCFVLDEEYPALSHR